MKDTIYFAVTREDVQFWNIQSSKENGRGIPLEKNGIKWQSMCMRVTVSVHCRVFSYLDVVSLCRCACVSKYWHQIALDGSNWQRVDLFRYQTCVKVTNSKCFVVILQNMTVKLH